MKKAESEQIVIALRDRGFPVEYICAPDEGHGFARPVNNMAMMGAAEKFLAKHLGGRHQEGGTTEVVAAPQGDHRRPQDRRARQEGRCRHGGRAQARGRPGRRHLQLPGHDRRRSARRWRSRRHRGIKEEGGTWVVTDSTKLPDGRGGGHGRPREGHARPRQAERQAGPGDHRDRLQGRQGHRHHGHGRRAQAVLGRSGRRDLRRRRGRPRGPGPPATRPRATPPPSATSTSRSRRPRSSR